MKTRIKLVAVALATFTLSLNSVVCEAAVITATDGSIDTGNASDLYFDLSTSASADFGKFSGTPAPSNSNGPSGTGWFLQDTSDGSVHTGGLSLDGRPTVTQLNWTTGTNGSTAALAANTTYEIFALSMFEDPEERTGVALGFNGGGLTDYGNAVPVPNLGTISNLANTRINTLFPIGIVTTDGNGEFILNIGPSASGDGRVRLDGYVARLIPVPEPPTLALSLLSLAFLGWRRRRRGVKRGQVRDRSVFGEKTASAV